MRLLPILTTGSLAGLAKINKAAMEIPILLNGNLGRIATIEDKSLNDELALNRHNEFRARHIETAPLVFDPLLCAAAQASADTIAAKRELSHDFADLKARAHGENLGMQWSQPNPPPVNYTVTIDAWYLDEIDFYNYSQPGFSIATSHFTQVVWKLTTSFCMRHAFSDDGLEIYYAARYVERGNKLRQFGENVMPLKEQNDEEHFQFDDVFVDGIQQLGKDSTTEAPEAEGSGGETTTTATSTTTSASGCECGFEDIGLGTGGCVFTGAGMPCDETTTPLATTSTPITSTTQAATTGTTATTTEATTAATGAATTTGTTAATTTATTTVTTTDSTASTTGATTPTTKSATATSTSAATTVSTTSAATLATTVATNTTTAASTTASTTVNTTETTPSSTNTTSAATTTTSATTSTAATTATTADTTPVTNSTTAGATSTSSASTSPTTGETSTTGGTTGGTTSATTTAEQTTTTSSSVESTTKKRTTASGDDISLPAAKEAAGEDLSAMNTGFTFVFDWMFGADSKFTPVDPSKVKRIRSAGFLSRFPGKNQKLIKRLMKCESADFGTSDFAREKFSSNPKIALEQVVVMYRNWIEANLSKCSSPFKGIAKRKHLINRIKRWKDFLLVKFCRFVDPSRKFCKA